MPIENGWIRKNIGVRDPDDVTLMKTTRYLRLSMIALVLGLGTAVVYEHAKTATPRGGHCWQESISAYYYTPVQSFFVGALVTIGISLIALKGNTEVEDILLNFAGIFAPFVAFVPTPNIGHCGSVLTDTTNRNLNVGNNVTAMLVMAGAAFVVLAFLPLWPKLRTKLPKSPGSAKPPVDKVLPVGKFGFGITFVFYLLVVFMFIEHRHWFYGNAHPIAAITMFVFIFLAVVDNAVNLRWSRPVDAHLLNRYTVVAAAMVIAALVIAGLKGFGHFTYWTIWLEASMIILFGVFWLIQTHELWDKGLRPDERPEVPGDGPPGASEVA